MKARETMDRLVREAKRLARRSGLITPSPVLFCHLPKCGGTSFRAVIEKEYRVSQCLFLYKVDELNHPEPSAEFIQNFGSIRDEIQIIYGHFKVGMHRYLNVPPCYVTVLREPIDRVVSLYYYYQRVPTLDGWHERVSRGMSLKEFGQIARNNMTDLLAGPFDGLGSEAAEERMLDQAKENIRRYFCAVGTTDNMERLVRVLGRRLGWRNHIIPNLNVRTQPRAPIDEETRAIIAKNNRLDTALYEWVKAGGMDLPAGGT